MAEEASSPVFFAALKYLEVGAIPTPLNPESKEYYSNTGEKDKVTLLKSNQEAARYFGNGNEKNLNIGVELGVSLGGTFPVVDVDLDCWQARELAPMFLPHTGAKFGRETSPCSHWIYRVSDISGRFCRKVFNPMRQGDDKGTLIELRAEGMTVFPPSVHKVTRQVIRWEAGCHLGAAGEVTEAILGVSWARLAGATLVASVWPSEGSRQDLTGPLAGWLLKQGWEGDEVLDFIVKIATVAKDDDIDERKGFITNTIEKFDADAPVSGYKGLVNILGHKGVKQLVSLLGVHKNKEKKPAVTEHSLTLKFMEEHGDNYRYMPWQGMWSMWNGKCWGDDDSGTIMWNINEVCNEIEPSFVKSQSRASSVERLTRVYPGVACGPDMFDVDPWLLNTPSGIVDLKTGVISEHDATKMMRKITSVAPSNETPHRWLSFLDEVTRSDKDMQDYLQRYAGYCLTGLTKEEMLMFLYGPGRNGKGVFVETLGYCYGSYAHTAPMSVFIEQRNEQHPTSIAALNGARLVIASETGGGQRWDEERVKSLTGGDRVRARFMRMDEFEFQPRCKLLFSGNNKPRLRKADQAMKHRIHMVPFDVVFEIQDHKLKELMRTREIAGGVLWWAIEGCLKWRDRGLQKPLRVSVASDDYIDSMDTYAQWAKERCEFDKDFVEATSVLFDNWRMWAEGCGLTRDDVAKDVNLSDWLKEHRYCRSAKVNYGKTDGQRSQLRGVKGVKLIHATSEVAVQEDEPDF